MKKIYLLLFIALLMASCQKGSGSLIKQLEEKPQNSFRVPDIQIHTYDNGLILYYLQNHELPVLEVAVLMGVGASDDPEGKMGLCEMMMTGLRTGGGQKYSGDEVDRLADQMAWELSTFVNREIGIFQIKSLDRHAEGSLDLFFDLLRHPRFENKKLEIIRQQMLTNIRLRPEDPGHSAILQFKKNLYGPDSPWARVALLETVEGLTQEDVFKLYQQKIAPNNIRLVVSGSLSFDEVVKKVEDRIQDWPAQSNMGRNLKPVEKKWDPQLILVDQRVNQSSIVMGHFGDKRFNPDKYALILANYILGGSTFGARLGNQIRTQLGLAYSIGSDFDLETDYGAFAIVVATKSYSTIKVIQEIKKILKEMQTTDPITREELSDAKKTILSTLIFEYEDPFNIVMARARYDYYGYPPDYLSIYQQKLEKVSLAEVHKALKTYFYPDKLIILVLGNKKEVGDLSVVGNVEEQKLDEVPAP